LVLVVKDIMPDAAVELGMLSNRTVIAVSRWMARSAYWLADEIHTLGEGMKRRIARELGGASKIRLVHDTVDGNELSPVPREENEFRLRFVPDGTFAILHTGNMGQKQDLDLLLRAAARLRDDRGYHFYVFGDGAVRDGFLAKRAAMGLANVSHYPLQERAFLRHMLSGADVVLVSQQPEVIDIVVPSKLITAMAAGAMIVAAAAAESETAKLVAGCEGGVVIPPSDEAALVYILQRIRARDVDVWGCRRRARAFALREFERGCVYGPIVEELCRSGVARFEG
jgi:colanic acid biosynthesis glycosyl transferase WcaI